MIETIQVLDIDLFLGILMTKRNLPNCNRLHIAIIPQINKQYRL
jgi:hypothetical protein